MVPEPLQGGTLFQLFLELTDEEEPTWANGAWQVVVLKDLTGLVPIGEGRSLPHRVIGWKAVDSYPSHPEDLDLVPDDVREAYEDLDEDLADVGSNLSTHIGGWAGWLVDDEPGQLVIQIDGDQCGLDLGFDGQLYLVWHDDQWRLHWQTG